ncbi:MAG TPA: hypothetical protein VFB44_17165 [Thermoleophilaceae bacterium]|nr:hypothetical protein [Thermoleophilaceae bacterium]
MPDLSALLMRRSVGALASSGGRCAECRRMPLAGEHLLELDSGRTLCELCFARLPDERRHAVRSERIHASDRPLSVVRRAA